MTNEPAPPPHPTPERTSLRELDRAGQRRWLWDHSGRLAGIALGGLGFAAMVFLAAIGFRPALFLVVLVVVGVAMISLGGRLRGR